MSTRRDFLKTSTGLAAATGIASLAVAPASTVELFKISLAEWSLNPLIFSGELDHLDFAKTARDLDIGAIEYVNQFFKDKAEDMPYLMEMRRRADSEGVKSLLIMCDNEGRLGDPDPAKRTMAVENHYKWANAAVVLGCHSIRVNAYSMGTWGSEPADGEEELKLVADGLSRLVEYGDKLDLNVLIENHGGNSSDGSWLASLMKRVGHPRCGTLPDFGNFTIFEQRAYDPYQGIDELMPFAKGVSVKPSALNPETGEPMDIDMVRMMKVVLDHGYSGYCGIEHGPKGAEIEGIKMVKDKLDKAHAALKP